MNQIDDDNGTRSGGTLGNEARLLLLRHSYMYLDNKKFGKVRWGLTNTPKDDITKDTDVTDLQDTMTSDNHMNRGFFLRPKGFDTEVGGAGQLKWQAISQCYSTSSAFDCSTRRNGVAYGRPELGGLHPSWGWAEDDIWGGALRYKKEWGENWEVGAGIAYEKSRDENQQNSGGGLNGFKRDIDEWAGMGSIKHKPTGLFAFSAFSFSDSNDSNRHNAGVFDRQEFARHECVGRSYRYPAQDGRARSLGDTSFFGGYLEINDGIGGAVRTDAGLQGRHLPRSLRRH